MSSRSEQTRNRIYQAALEEFAQYGVSGARVDRIAREAKANKQAIYLYYDDKEKLFTLVLGRALEELAEAVPAPAESDDIATYIDRLFTYHKEHPAILRLLLWEALEHPGVPVPDEAARTEHYQHKAHALGKASGIGGSTLPELDPQALLLVFTALVGWPLAIPQVTRMIMGDGPEAMDRIKAASIAVAQAVTGTAQESDPA
ncbi:TetR/AcrR family transcriptional regulator [Streptomyces hundungensis]|uniref:TetR/AcrR family transcriptional regulator n=1 Tax=Streptomyces hundungensis TaxID=1077946 RepID=UPI0033F9302B